MAFKTIDELVERVETYDREFGEAAEKYGGNIKNFYDLFQRRFMDVMDEISELYKEGTGESADLEGKSSYVKEYMQIIIWKNCMKKIIIDDVSQNTQFYSDFFDMMERYSKRELNELPKIPWEEMEDWMLKSAQDKYDETSELIQKYQTRPLVEREFSKYWDCYYGFLDGSLDEIVKRKYGCDEYGNVNSKGISVLSIARAYGFAWSFAINQGYDILI